MSNALHESSCAPARFAAALLASSALIVPGLASVANAQVSPGSPSDQIGVAAPQADRDAASSQTDDQAGRDVVIVTAERRETDLQSTPVSVTALSGENLDAQGVTDLTDLSGMVPNFVVGGSAGHGGNNSVALRGVSGLGQPVGAEQQVAIYLDGVYLARPESALFNLADVQRLEILRGPQGTLYGRNSTGGAVNIITERPGQEFKASLSGRYGNFYTREAQAFISGGLTNDISGSLSVSHSAHDGYLINTVTGNAVGDEDGTTVRGKLRYLSPGGEFDVIISGDATRQWYQEYFVNAVNPDTRAIVGITSFDHVASTYPESAADTTRDLGGLSVTADYEINDNWTWVSAISERWYDARVNYDLKGGVFTTFLPPTHSIIGSDTFSGETRLSYTSDVLNLVIGADYFTLDELFESRPGTAAAPAIPGPFPNPHYDSQLTSYGIFGQANYKLTPELELVAGGRYSSEERDFGVQYLTDPIRRGTQDADAFLPKIGVNYQATDDIFLYASASKGFGGPGFTGRGRGNPVNTFNAEYLWAYEAGAKTQWFDGALTLNLSVFQSDFTDLQVRRIIGVGLVETNNAAAATIKGVELEGSADLGAGFSLNFQGAYLDARYDRFDDFDGATPVSRAGNRMNRAPEWSGGAHLSYEREFGDDMQFNANVGVTSQAESFYNQENRALFGNPGWTTWDARAGVGLGDRYKVYVYAKNLTDERYVTHVIAALPTLALSAFNDPRTFGIGFEMEY